VRGIKNLFEPEGSHLWQECTSINRFQ